MLEDQEDVVTANGDTAPPAALSAAHDNDHDHADGRLAPVESSWPPDSLRASILSACSLQAQNDSALRAALPEITSYQPLVQAQAPSSRRNVWDGERRQRRRRRKGTPAADEVRRDTAFPHLFTGWTFARYTRLRALALSALSRSPQVLQWLLVALEHDQHCEHAEAEQTHHLQPPQSVGATTGVTASRPLPPLSPLPLRLLPLASCTAAPAPTLAAVTAVCGYLRQERNRRWSTPLVHSNHTWVLAQFSTHAQITTTRAPSRSHSRSHRRTSIDAPPDQGDYAPPNGDEGSGRSNGDSGEGARGDGRASSRGDGRDDRRLRSAVVTVLFDVSMRVGIPVAGRTVWCRWRSAARPIAFRVAVPPDAATSASTRASIRSPRGAVREGRTGLLEGLTDDETADVLDPFDTAGQRYETVERTLYDALVSGFTRTKQAIDGTYLSPLQLNFSYDDVVEAPPGDVLRALCAPARLICLRTVPMRQRLRRTCSALGIELLTMSFEDLGATCGRAVQEAVAAMAMGEPTSWDRSLAGRRLRPAALAELIDGYADRTFGGAPLRARRIVRLGPPLGGMAGRIELDPAERVPALHALLPWHPAELMYVDRSPPAGGAVAVVAAGQRYYDLHEGLLQACAPRLAGHPLWLVNSVHVPGRAWLYVGNGGDTGQGPDKGPVEGTDAWQLEHGKNGGALGASSERETEEEWAWREAIGPLCGVDTRERGWMPLGELGY